MVLVFDVRADMAMFRKPYTTTSQVSFAVPPPTAIAGLVAALAGIEHRANVDAYRAEFWQKLHGSRIAIGLLRPIQWFSTTVNLIKFKSANGDMAEHIQSKHQLIKNPCYRVYFQNGDIYVDLKRRLEREEFVFTPYLGVAYALADIAYVGEFEAVPINDTETWVDSIVPLYNGVHLDVMKGRGLHREKIPFQMNHQRELKQTVTVIYPEITPTEDELFSNRIWLKNRGELDVSQVGTERVGWFERWADL